MKEKIKGLGDWIEDKLRSLCGEVTPDKRLTIIVISLLVATIANLYLTFSAVYNLGQDNGKKNLIEIEHIKQLELEKSTNHLNKGANEYNE